MDKNRLIGNKGQLPWHITEDLAWFKRQTIGHTVIMGHKTWLSLSGALAGRRNIVLSSNPDFRPSKAEVAHSTAELENLIAGQDAFIIGGASVFYQFLPIADKLYITYLDAAYKGDTYFPEYNAAEWLVVSQEELLSSSGVRLQFCIYTRKQ